MTRKSQRRRGRDGLIGGVRDGMQPEEDLPDLDEVVDESSARSRPKGLIERVEETVTIAFFAVMFITVVMGVFWRYVLNQPLLWTVNLATIAFIWVIMVGSGLLNRDEEHIQFDLVYNRASGRVQRWFRIVGNVLIIVPFAVAIPATISYVRFMGGNKVTGLNLTFDWAYAGVVIFLAATVLHRGRLLLNDLRGRDVDESSR